MGAVEEESSPTRSAIEEFWDRTKENNVHLKQMEDVRKDVAILPSVPKAGMEAMPGRRWQQWLYGGQAEVQLSPPMRRLGLRSRMTATMFVGSLMGK